MKLMSTDMYKAYAINQVNKASSRDEKLFWLLAEERHLTREATKYSRENPDKATDILLNYLSRLTFVRREMEKYQTVLA